MRVRSVVGCSTDNPCNFASNLAVERSGLLLKRGDLVAVADQGVLTTDVRKDESFLLGPDGDFLNPMLVGISSYFELHNFVETEDHYKFWSVPSARFWKHRYIGDQLVFNRGREKVVFDKRFGFGITEYRTEGKDIAYTCSYKKVQGLWLPDSARIESGSRRHTAVDIEWVAVNRPIDERLFDPLWIARQAGLEWEAE